MFQSWRIPLCVYGSTNLENNVIIAVFRGLSKEQQRETSVGPEPPLPFPCNVCSLSFARTWKLEYIQITLLLFREAFKPKKSVTFFTVRGLGSKNKNFTFFKVTKSILGHSESFWWTKNLGEKLSHFSAIFGFGSV